MLKSDSRKHIRAAASWLILLLLILAPNAYVMAQGQNAPVTAIDWNPQGNQIAVGYQNGALAVLNAYTRQIEYSTHITNSPFRSLEWSPVNSAEIAINLANGFVGVVNIANPSSSRYFGSGEAISSISWSPNGTKIAGAVSRYNYTNVVMIWDAATGTVLATFEGHSNALTSVDWSPDGSRIVSTSVDSQAIIWDANSGTILFRLNPLNGTGLVSPVTWNTTGSQLALVVHGGFPTHSEVQIWDAATAQLLARYQRGFVADIEWNPLSNLLAIADGETVEILDLASGQVQNLIQSNEVVDSLSWHPNGADIAFDIASGMVDIRNIAQVQSFSLLDTSGNTRTISDNMQIPASSSVLRFRANTNPATVGSISFELNGQVVWIDDTAPYEYDLVPTLGTYTLRATPYSGAGGTGNAGTPLLINFSINASTSLGRIVFEHNDHIYSMNPDGTNRIDLGLGNAPAISPDGRRIAFWRYTGDGQEIFAMNADGSNPIQLTNNRANDRDPAWSPDGTRIVYASMAGGSDWELHIMNADGSNNIQLTDNDSDDTAPSWSVRDVIAFTARREDYKQIYTILPNGTGRIRLANQGVDMNSPEWSPDGTMLVYYTSGGSGDDIHRINANGSDHLRLTRDSSSDIYPSWSPDGSQIIFSSDRAGGSMRELFIMNMDGSAQSRLTFTGMINETMPVWVNP